MRFWEFSESVKAGMRRRQASFVRRVSGISPPHRSRRQRGLHRLLTHQALGSDEHHRVHAHIDAAFQFRNGLSWTRVAGDASLPHYCQCCASDNEAQEAGVEILQSLADDASCKDFMASRWHKKVTPMQIWTALVMLDTNFQVAEQAGNKKRKMAGDFNGIVQEILSSRRTKSIRQTVHFCKPTDPRLRRGR